MASSIKPSWKPIQLLTSAKVATGAAVESTKKASFSRDSRAASAMGRMVLPTTKVLV